MTEQQHLLDTIEMDRGMIEAKKDVATEKRDNAMKLVEELKAPVVGAITDANAPARFKAEQSLVWMEEVDGVSVKSIAAVKSHIRTLDPPEESEVEEHDEAPLNAAREALVTAQEEHARMLEWVGKQVQGIDLHKRNDELLRANKASIEEIEAAQDEITEEDKKTQVEVVDEAIAEKQTQIEKQLLFVNAENQIEEHQKKVKKLEGMVGRWDKLAKALDPKNPDLSALLSDEFQTFRSFVARDSEALGVKATVNTDFSIDVVTKDGPISNLEWASKSEQYRVGVALLFGVCDLVGLDSVVLDEGEVVHGENRKALKELIKTNGGIKTTILLETGDPHAKPHPNKDVSIHNIADGVIL